MSADLIPEGNAFIVDRYAPHELDKIVHATSAASGIELGRIMGPQRHRDLTSWRQAGMTFAADLGHKLEAVGMAFGRDRTTVMYARTRCADAVWFPQMRDAIEAELDHG